MKKISVILFAVSAIAVFALLLFFRLNKTETDTAVIAKTITPVGQIKKNNSETEAEPAVAPAPRTAEIMLKSGETFMSDCDVDLNVDGFDDKVAAVWLEADNVVSIIPAILNPIQKTYTRGSEIKTEITQSTGIGLYSLDLELGEKPAIVCSGTARDNVQILTIFLIDETKDGTISLRQVAVFRADVQIRISKNERAQSSGLGLYTVSCFESDSSTPNTLTQIEKVYTWSEQDSAFKKTTEHVIPGEKIESQMLRKIGNGNVALFREFLQGLWIQQNENANTAESKLLYFNSAENEITFTNGELQEIYVISNVSQRRYGIYFTTYNKSLNTIILRIDIEIKSLTEITVRVAESVTRLKIGAGSLWDGIYTKKDNTIRSESDVSPLASVEKLLKTQQVSWKNDRYNLQIENDTYTFKTPDGTLSGTFTLVPIHDKVILQLRSAIGTFFYEVTPMDAALVLLPVELKMNKIKNTGAEKIVLMKIIR